MRKFFKDLFRETVATAIPLFEIMIPVAVIVKVMETLGLVAWISRLVAPVMGLVGLPGELGLAWATSWLTNMYGGMIVFISVVGNLSLTTADATVFGAMILVAHSLPVEAAIARRAGVQTWFTVALRLVGSLLLGVFLHHCFDLLGVLQGPMEMTWTPEPPDASLSAWVLGQSRNYVLIFIVIFLILLVMKLLNAVKILDRINALFEPGLEALGMSKEAAPLTIVGLVLGISYGGGLIIAQAKSGKLPSRDAFLSVSLLGLSHSLVEDTILMMTLGGSLWGLLFGRLLFSLAVMLVLIRLLEKTSNAFFEKWLCA